jgi:hypothetical protein
MAPRVHPQHALAVYAESLAAGARVAVFGDCSLGLAERLVELGAHTVQVWDPDAERARSASPLGSRAVTVRAYEEPDSDLRPIDLVIISDLGLFEDSSGVVRRARRMVGEEGVAIVAARSAEIARVEGVRAFDYYDLFDLLAPEFDSIRMIAQLPFYGIALVELGDEDEAPGVNVDTQLGESGRAPEAFVVVASQRDVRLEPYSIVQLPPPAPPVRDTAADEAAQREVLAREALAREAFAREAFAREAIAREAVARETVQRDAQMARDAVRETTARDAAAREAMAREAVAREATREALARESAARDALAQAQLRIDLLASQLEDLRARQIEGERASATVSALEETLRARTTQAVELERALGARGRELAELSAEVEEVRAAAEAGRIAAAQVAEVALRADRAERRVVSLEHEHQELTKGGDTQSRELVDLERALRERAQVVRSLEAELARREQMVRDLIGLLDEAGGSPVVTGERAPQDEARRAPRELPAEVAANGVIAEENARLRAQLDALALDLARREGDAQATAWQVGELERRLAQLQTEKDEEALAPALSSLVDPRLAQALDELDALRTALAQEHDARARAESGEELARARAEIERQAVLMEQLVRELGPRPGGAFGGTVGGAAGSPPGSSEDSR